MGEPTAAAPAMLVIAASGASDESIAWVRQTAAARYGEPWLASEQFNFIETDYYRETMGPNLRKQFLAFAPPFDPAELPAVKLVTNHWEAVYAGRGRGFYPRPVNIDPGYLTSGKLVLASTKDHSHRVYLAQGIYAEVTLCYKLRRWQPREWTYPDYRRADYHEFFSAARGALRAWIKGEGRT